MEEKTGQEINRVIFALIQALYAISLMGVIFLPARGLQIHFNNLRIQVLQERRRMYEIPVREQRQEDVAEGAVCSICLIEYEVGGPPVTELSCSAKHKYHTECIKQWLAHHKSCPICRSDTIG